MTQITSALSPFPRARPLINQDSFLYMWAGLTPSGDNFRSVLGPPPAPCSFCYADFCRLPLFSAEAYGRSISGYLLRFDVYYV